MSPPSGLRHALGTTWRWWLPPLLVMLVIATAAAVGLSRIPDSPIVYETVPPRPAP